MATREQTARREKDGSIPPQLEYLKQFHDEAFLLVSQGLSAEEGDDSKSALLFYERGLQQIDQALSIQTDGRDCVGPAWDEAKTLQSKMRRTRLEILERLSNLQLTRSMSGSMSGSMTEAQDEAPPSYEEAMQSGPSPQWLSSEATQLSSSSSSSLSSAEIVTKVSTMNADGAAAFAVEQSVNIDGTLDIPANAEEMFSLAEVQIFFVAPDGFVSAPSYPTSLKIYKFKVSEKEAAATAVPTAPVGVPAFLQVGTWMYPLIPGHSPVLQSSYGAYIFPDTSAHHTGAAVGLIFPDDVDRESRIIFEHILCEFTIFRPEGTAIQVEGTPGKARLSRRISDGIVKGAVLLARGVEFGAERTSLLVKSGAEKLRTRMTPVPEPKEVNPKVTESLKVAKEVSTVAVGISGYVVRKVGDATMCLGRYLAPQIRRHGSLLLSKAMNEDATKSNKKIDDILEVAAGGMKGFATVYIGLESAARMLASSLANETVQLVHHKYGDQAGGATGNALNTVGNFTMAAYNVHTLGVKGIMKRTAQNAGKALVEDYEIKKQETKLEKQPPPRPPAPKTTTKAKPSNLLEKNGAVQSTDEDDDNEVEKIDNENKSLVKK